MHTEDRNPHSTGQPQEQPTGADEAPKFGRLLLVLLAAVLVVVAMTFLSEAYYS
jgi:hypothetical protein